MLPQPTAAQKLVLTQCTAFIETPTFVTVQAAPPPVGVVEVITLPSWSTATQRLVLGHDTLCRTPEPLMWAAVQTEAAPGRLVEDAAGAGDAAGVVAIRVGEGLDAAPGVLAAVAIDSRGDGVIDPVALPHPESIKSAARNTALM